ncbi:MAG: GNAT family N-acetyltransferase [Beijerinckiaceae bacterium]|nr:GNAT family N-acetyltransferase [Beijerinckiaceae bacterium]
MGVLIRPLDATQRDAWEPLWQGYLAFYKANLAEGVSDLTFQRLSAADGMMGGFLAWDGERAVGMVHWIRHPSCWTAGDYCYLQDLFVDPDARGRGAGRALIEAVYNQARMDGCSRVYWLTHETNHEAMQLYDRIAERSGFVQYRKML